MGVTLTDVLLFGKAQSDDVDNATLVIYRRNILRWSALGGYLDIIVKGVSPLSLPDAVANSLSYVKAFGGTEQRNLPSEYTELQYIESTGTQYIDTGIVTQNGIGFDVTFLTNNSIGIADYGAILGGRVSSGSDDFQITTFTPAESTMGTIRNGSSTPVISAKISTNTKLHISLISDVITYNDGTTASVSNYEYTTGKNIYLFGLNNADSFTQSGAGCRIYNAKLLVGSNVVFDGIPAKQGTTVGMYDLVSGQFFTNAGTGDFVAGPDAVPTPDAPVDIVSNNGAIKVSPNLLDIPNMQETRAGITASVNNGLVTLTGTTESGYNLQIVSSSQPVLLKAGTYTVSYTGTFEISAGTILLQIRQLGGSTIDTLSNTKSYTTLTLAEDTEIYLNINVGATGRTLNVSMNVQIEKGSTATDYKPYGQIYTDGTVETINAHGKNLIDESTLVKVSATIWRYYSTTSQGGFNLKANTTYTLSTDNPNINVYFYDYETKTSIVSGKSFKTYTPTEDVTVYFTLYLSAGIPDDMHIQLEIGDTATDYEPYYDGGTATAEMLLKVGDYQDVQEILSGNITRNVGVKVLDGTEPWIVASGADNAYLQASELPGVKTSSPVLCSHLINSSTGVPRIQLTSVLRVYGIGTEWADKANFQSWLADQYAAGTPVIVLYPLATPTTEVVTGQTLQVAQGDNVLEITQASIDGLELEAKYAAAVALTIQEVQDANLDPNVEVTIN